MDELAGIRIKELKLREVPFLRADVPLYDVMKVGGAPTCLVLG